MAVQFIVGRAGAGKSHYLYEKLIEKSLKYRNKNFIAIVPEQFSMETQKQILQCILIGEVLILKLQA